MKKIGFTTLLLLVSMGLFAQRSTDLKSIKPTIKELPSVQLEVPKGLHFSQKPLGAISSQSLTDPYKKIYERVNTDLELRIFKGDCNCPMPIFVPDASSKFLLKIYEPQSGNG
ncbi:MAG: hypothetical protein AAF489_00760 [Bacteroidota bacterium]